MEKRTRILHINCNYLGTALHQTMIRNLNSVTENQVFCPYHESANCVITPDSNVITSLCFKKRDRIVFSYKQSKIIREIKKRLDIKSFDVIHAYTLFTDGNVAMNLSETFGCPFVVAVRATDVDAFFRYRPWLIKRGTEIMRKASAVFFLSQVYKEKVLQKYVSEKYRQEIEKKSYVIPNGIDSFWLENLPLEKKKEVSKEKDIRVIYAGTIIKRKNIPMIQKALAEVRNKGYRVSLTVVGKVIDQKEFRRIQKDAETRYYPSQPKEQLIDFYRKSDIFCMPSWQETFGLVYAEAMSQGLPVIYSKGQGFDGQFKDGTVGYAVDYKSKEDICNKILMLVENYQQIQANTVPAAKAFDWNDIVHRYCQIYKAVAR